MSEETAIDCDGCGGRGEVLKIYPAGSKRKDALVHCRKCGGVGKLLPWKPEAPRFKAGDAVDCRRWDQYERPEKRLGIQQVIAVEVDQVCESGVMVRITGREPMLDQGWLAPVEATQAGLGI